MTATEDKRIEFVQHLRGLDRKQDRGALAELRADLRGHSTDRYRAGKHVVPYLGEHASKRDEWFYVVGGLFALHSMDSVSIGNFGESLRALRNDSDSLDLRFLALLDAPRADVPRHLRGLVGQLAAKAIAVNWERLLRDLCAWDSADRPIQEQWARSYYYRKAETTPDAAGPDDTKGNENEG